MNRTEWKTEPLMNENEWKTELMEDPLIPLNNGH